MNCFDQLIEVLESLDQSIYCAKIPELPHGTLGAHVRHSLEFFICFLEGMEDGKVDYSLRKRDELLELYPQKAIEMCETLNGELLLTMKNKSECEIFVKSENQLTEGYCKSSVLREIDYLIQHLTHHESLIAVILRRHGVDVPVEFGVANSTLKYWSQDKVCAP